MYKKIHAQPLGKNKYKIHLWEDSGYDIIHWSNPAYEECSEREAEYLSLDGKHLKKTYKWNREDTHNLHFHDMPAYQKFLIEKYGTNDEPSKSHVELFYDIEIEMGESLTPEYIKESPKPITSIAYYNKWKDEWGIFILDKKGLIKNSKIKNKLIFRFKTEKELLAKWVEKFREIDPDILIGFNSNYFDNPYLYNRICKVLGEEWANFLSPINIVQDISQWSRDQYIQIAGVESLDYLALHKKYYWRDEPQWNLNYLGLKYANLGKIEYDGSLDRLYEEDPNKFVEYNFRDVEIIVKLDEKLEYIDLTKNISHKGKIKYGEILSNSKVHDGAISSYLLSQNIVPPSRNPNSISKKDYAGGYLFCPQKGLFKYVFDEDLASLYPSIIRSLNIGLETYVARILWDNDRYNRLGLNDLKALDPNFELTIENDQFKRIKLSVKELIKIIVDNKFSISANGVMFRTDKKSALAEILEKWFDERALYKKLMKEAYKSGNNDLGKRYHLSQWTQKILLVSLYGALALGSFRFGNVIFSEAITLSGQRIIQDSILFINNHINNRMKNEKV